RNAASVIRMALVATTTRAAWPHTELRAAATLGTEMASRAEASCIGMQPLTGRRAHISTPNRENPVRLEPAVSPADRVQHASGQVADDPQRDEDHRQRYCRRGGYAGAGEERDERDLARSNPVERDGQEHHEKNQRDERDVGAERRVDPKPEPQVV